MNEHTSPSVDAEPDFAAVEYDHEYWQRRALEAEHRLEAHKALADEQAEIRRRGTEMLEESRAAVERECTEWRARAEVAEAKVAEYLAGLEQKYVELDAELDGWRRRALAAEAVVAEHVSALDQLRASVQHEDAEHKSDSVASTEALATAAKAAPPSRDAPARRPRGNWLR
jgi:hypothetical protein